MMCDVLKSSKRGIRFPFKTRTPLLSLLQILAFEANNILNMKQIKQLPLCYPLSGFTSLIISNSLWCWCLPKKPFPAHPWPTTADLKKPGLSQRRFSSGLPICPDMAGRTIITVAICGHWTAGHSEGTQGALFIARFVCSAEPDPHQQRTFFWILRKLDVFRLSAAAIVLSPLQCPIWHQVCRSPCFFSTFSLFISLVLKYKIIPAAAPVPAQSRSCWCVTSAAHPELGRLGSRLVISFINPFLAATGASQFVTGSSPAAVTMSWSVSPIISPEDGAGEILGVTCGHQENGFIHDQGKHGRWIFASSLSCRVWYGSEVWLPSPDTCGHSPLARVMVISAQRALESAHTGCCSAWVQLPCYLIQLFSVRKNLPDALHHYYQ